MRWIDISHVLDENTPVYPGDPAITLSRVKSIEQDHYCAYLLSSGLHTGTHIDMPMHLTGDKRMAKDFPPDNFTGRGVLLDVRGEKNIAMKAAYTRSVPDESIVLLFTGFDRFYHGKKYFDGHPELSRELGDFLLSRNIRMLGMDMPGPDYPPFPIHKALLEKGVCILENLCNLQSLAGVDPFEVYAFPLKISAEAAFVRAVCRVD